MEGFTPIQALPVGVVLAFVELQRRTSSCAEMRRACDDLSRALIAKDALSASRAAFDITGLATRLPLTERDRDMFSLVGYYWQLYGSPASPCPSP